MTKNLLACIRDFGHKKPSPGVDEAEEDKKRVRKHPWTYIRDVAERTLDDGGFHESHIEKARWAAIDYLMFLREQKDNAGVEDDAAEDESSLGYWVYWSIKNERHGCCDWERVARVCEGLRRCTNKAVGPESYDPKAEGARKLTEGWR